MRSVRTVSRPNSTNFCIVIHNHVMKCLRCQSDNYSKNGFQQGKQKYICKSCGRQWIGDRRPRGYPLPVRDLCLTMHRNGLEAKVIGQYTGISYNTIINWVKQSQQQRLPTIEAVGHSEPDEEGDRQDFITLLVATPPAMAARLP
jgi:transposase-like protein